jgi:hypothetical protein
MAFEIREYKKCFKLKGAYSKENREFSHECVLLDREKLDMRPYCS